jgi:IS5 family transposase
MNVTCRSRLSQCWNHLQHELFPFLREEDHLELSPTLEKVIRVLEFTQVDGFIPSSRGFVGRPPKDRVALARAFVAKAVLDLPTTEALIDRLKADRALRRICGFERFRSIPAASRFSRAFAEFTALELPARVHEALIRSQLGDQIIGHIARDATEIEAREKPARKAKLVASCEMPTEPKKRGRPKKGEERPKAPTRIECQVAQTAEQSRAELPTACDVGSKKNSKGYKETWIGYKLHIDTADGDIPVHAILTSASVHDSQVAIPLMRQTSQRVTYLYDLADAAYCSPILREESRRLGHVPLIDHNPRRGEKIDFAPHEAERYKARSQVERTNSQLKDNHGGRHVRVRGPAKVYTHLMFGILVIAAEQILRLLN